MTVSASVLRQPQSQHIAFRDVDANVQRFAVTDLRLYILGFVTDPDTALLLRRVTYYKHTSELVGDQRMRTLDRLKDLTNIV